MLGNHVTDWDGLYLNTYLGRFIYFIVHDEIFKYKFRKILAYNLLGQIKRGKAKNDVGPLRKLIEMRNAGKCIGIFPEGDISYTGRSLYVDKSIAKLCKILKIPVVLTRLDGASFQRPRWSYEIRKTKIKLTITDVISVDDLKNTNCDMLYDRIMKGITYDDSKYQETVFNRIKAKRPAQNLEYVLFMCPDCNGIHCMESKKDSFYCTKCGFTVRYNEFNQFYTIKGKTLVKNITAWDDLQKQRLHEIINKSREQNSEIISLNGFSYNKVPEGDFFYRPSGKGTLSLNHERLKFTFAVNNAEEIYYLKDIKDLYIQFKGAVEFSMGNFRYRFKSTIGRHYGYWYECFIKAILQGEENSNG